MLVGSSRPFTSGSGGASGKQRVIMCYNCKGEGHMSKQCTKPKRKRDAEWFKDKVLLVQAQANGQVLQEDELEFVADPRTAESSSNQNCLIDEVTEVQNIFKQMELAIEQHRKEKNKVRNKMENVLKENDRLLTQALSVEIMNVVVHDNVTSSCLNVDVCAHCVTIESKLKKDFIKKKCYETLLQKYHALEKHCISLEVNDQLNKEIFQRNTLSSPESAPTFAELFEINDLKAQAQAKDTVIFKLKEKLRSLNGDVNELNVKREVEKIETLNIELDHKVDVAPLVPKLRKNRTAHTDYIRHTQEEAATLREIVESERLLSPLNTSLDYALPPREPILIVNSTDKPVVTLVYSRKSKAANKKVPNKMEPNNSWGSTSSNVPSSLIACRLSKSSSDGVDLLTGSRGNNLYTLSLQDMMASSPICLLSKASKTKSWLWHRRLSHLNFGAINHLARQGLVRGLSKLKFEKDHLCSTPYELLHSKLPDLSFFHVFGALCYPTNDSENLGKLQLKANIGIFIGYALTKKAFRFYNRRTKRIVETIHVDFNELTAMASEQRSSGPALNEMTPGTISSGLVRSSSPSTSYVPPSRNDWDLLFQPMFDELLNPPPSVVNQAPGVIAPIAEVIPLVHDDSTDSPSSTMVDQDAPSPSKTHTTTEIQSSVIPQDVGDDNLDMEVAHMGNDLLFGVPIPEVTSAQSSSTASPQTIVQTNHPMPHHNSKWTKDHPLNNIIGQISRPVSTRLQLYEQALFCYYNAFLTSVEPKTYKEALTQSCWIEAMQEELNEFERLEV
nr:integrase, catalytic region, zinc finger, CCHC-type, peptidase aspartic, catalytic [Tanacetum cinerariifolium]